jgi:adenylate cyclase
MVANAPDIREDAAMDFEAAGLLEGLSDEEREGRLRLLEQLSEEGVSVEELAAAVKEHRLALVPVDRVLGGRHSAREIERETDVPAALLLRIRRLTGLPEATDDDAVFADEDIAMAQSTKLFLDAGIGEEALSQITRVLGESMSRLAATITALFADAFLQPGDTEADVGLRFAALAEQLTPALTPVLTAAFKAHLRESVSRGMLGQAELATGRVADEQDVAVCFADVVGFTRLGGEVDVHELGTVAGRLGELANEVARSPVRLVKTIGDAAMLVSQEPAALIDAALSLVEAMEEAELPALRAGIALGPAQIRAGDYFGHSVNLASRVTGAARPGSVLCTEEVRDAAEGQFAFSAAGRHRLKGVSGQVPLYRARRVEGADDDDADSRKPKADRRRRRASR